MALRNPRVVADAFMSAVDLYAESVAAEAMGQPLTEITSQQARNAVKLELYRMTVEIVEAALAAVHSKAT